MTLKPKRKRGGKDLGSLEKMVIRLLWVYSERGNDMREHKKKGGRANKGIRESRGVRQRERGVLDLVAQPLRRG